MTKVLAETRLRNHFTCLEFEIHSIEFPVFVQSMSLNIEMSTNVPSNCSGFICRAFRSFCIYLRMSIVVNPRKIFHSNSIGSPSIPDNSAYSFDS